MPWPRHAFDAGKKRPTGWRPLEIRSRRLSVSPYVLQETNGSVKFRPAEPVEVELEVVKTLRLEVWDVALRRIIAVAEMETKDLEKRRHWRLLLQDPLTSEAVYGTAPRGPDSLDRTLRPLNRRPSFLHLLIQVSEPGSFVQETPSSASTPSTASRSEANLTTSVG
eukprot:g11505.t1